MSTPTLSEKLADRPTYYRMGRCAWCGQFPDDDERLSDRNYCRSCHAERQAQYRARRRQARLSSWYAEVGTADAERAAILVSALVDELGGYKRAARQLAEWIKAINAEGKAPGQAMRANTALLRLIRLALPAE